MKQGVQLAQSGYLSLQTPYVMFGLGRTSNYIEQFFMGVSVNQVLFNTIKLITTTGYLVPYVDLYHSELSSCWLSIPNQ